MSPTRLTESEVEKFAQAICALRLLLGVNLILAGR